MATTSPESTEAMARLLRLSELCTKVCFTVDERLEMISLLKKATGEQITNMLTLKEGKKPYLESFWKNYNMLEKASKELPIGLEELLPDLADSQTQTELTCEEVQIQTELICEEVQTQTELICEEVQNQTEPTTVVPAESTNLELPELPVESTNLELPSLPAPPILLRAEVLNYGEWRELSLDEVVSKDEDMWLVLRAHKQIRLFCKGDIAYSTLKKLEYYSDGTFSFILDRRTTVEVELLTPLGPCQALVHQAPTWSNLTSFKITEKTQKTTTKLISVETKNPDTGKWQKVSDITNANGLLTLSSKWTIRCSFKHILKTRSSKVSQYVEHSLCRNQILMRDFLWNGDEYHGAVHRVRWGTKKFKKLTQQSTKHILVLVETMNPNTGKWDPVSDYETKNGMLVICSTCKIRCVFKRVRRFVPKLVIELSNESNPIEFFWNSQKYYGVVNQLPRGKRDLEEENTESRKRLKQTSV